MVFNGGGGNDVWLNQAYIEYMPISGWTLTAGKFGTHIGYEVAGAANNVMMMISLAFKEKLSSGIPPPGSPSLPSPTTHPRS